MPRELLECGLIKPLWRLVCQSETVFRNKVAVKNLDIATLATCYKIGYVTGYMECGLIKPLWRRCVPIENGAPQQSCG